MANHPTVQLLLQPPQSPDVTPLDQSIFKYLDDSVQQQEPKTRAELHTCVGNAWQLMERSKIVDAVLHQTIIRRQIVTICLTLLLPI